MRTIDEFKQDREQWNRETAKKQKIRAAIGWAATVVVVVVLAVVGWNTYQKMQTDKDAAPAQNQEIETPGTGS